LSAPVAVGRFVRRERDRTHQAAVSEERARIARELHDVVAHGVSVIAVQADAAEAALEHDPTRAATPLRSIRGSAHEALTEMRRMVGVLGETHERGPQPGLAQLPALIQEAGATLVVEGEPVALPASLDLAAYRIVQEALTNVRKHAGGAPTTVRVTWRDAQLELDDAVNTVAAGDALFAPTVLQRLVAHYVHRPPPGAARLDGPLAELSGREAEVLRLVGRGLSNAEISDELVISTATVKTHVRHVLQKLGLRDRVQAVALAYEAGLV